MDVERIIWMRDVAYALGIVISAFAILVLAIGYVLTASGTFGGAIVGIGFLCWYAIIGLIGSLLILLGKTPAIGIKYSQFLIPLGIATSELILTVMVLSLASYDLGTLLFMVAPPLILIAKSVLVYKGILTTAKIEKEMRFFKKI